MAGPADRLHAMTPLTAELGALYLRLAAVQTEADQALAVGDIDAYEAAAAELRQVHRSIERAHIELNTLLYSVPTSSSSFAAA